MPWSLGDATRLYLFNSIGAFVLVLGWVGVSGTADLSDQFAWTSLAVCGFLTASVGEGLWLLAGRRAVGARLAELLAVESLLSGEQDVPASAAPERAPVGWHAPGTLVAAAAASRFHQPDCILARGKEVVVDDRAGHSSSGRVACEVCAP